MVPLTFTLMITASAIHRGDSSGFPLDVWTHSYYGYYDFALSHVIKDGSALRGTRVRLVESDVESG